MDLEGASEQYTQGVPEQLPDDGTWEPPLGEEYGYPQPPPIPTLAHMSPPPSPPRVWTVYAGFGMMMASLLVLGLGMGVILGISLSLEGPADKDELIERIMDLLFSPPIMAVTMLLTTLVVVAAACIPAMLSPESFRQRLGLLPAKKDWTVIAAMTIAVVAWSEVLASSMLLLGLESEALQMISQAVTGASGAVLLLLFLDIGIIGPIGEELMCRGYVQTRLCRRHGPALGIIIASILFGIMHMDLVQGFFAALLGLFLGYAAWSAKSILPAILGHILNNLLAVAALRWLPSEAGPALAPALIAGSIIVLILCLAWIRLRKDISSAGGEV
jgi:uncharacterized protein